MLETLTFVYNEEFLLPYYLKHYSFCDKFNIVYDTDSTDNTLAILEQNLKVNIIPFSFPDQMDDQLKVNFINSYYASMPEGIKLFNVDADEFIFTDRNILEWKDNYFVKLYNVYRHESESDLDINKPIQEQRRHGEHLPIYRKPIIVNTGLDIKWGVGNHHLFGIEVDDIGITGSHWANADISFCVDRRVKNRKQRQSRYNLEHGLTVQHHGISEIDVLNECEKHKTDPLVF